MISSASLSAYHLHHIQDSQHIPDLPFPAPDTGQLGFTLSGKTISRLSQGFLTRTNLLLSSAKRAKKSRMGGQGSGKALEMSLHGRLKGCRECVVQLQKA